MLRQQCERNSLLSSILIFVPAKKRRKRRAVEPLLGSPADVNSPDQSGWTPLMRACVSKPLDKVRATIAAGADVNKHDEDGFGPLMCASVEGRADVIELLLQHGAQVDAVDEDGRSPLSWWSRRATSIEQHNR